MRRADRMLDIVARLKARSLVRAEDLAEAAETSVRTIYRDIATLQAQGLPIEGQAGVGYMVRGDIHLPPLVFDHDHSKRSRSASLMSSRSATPSSPGPRGRRAPRSMRRGPASRRRRRRNGAFGRGRIPTIARQASPRSFAPRCGRASWSRSAIAMPTAEARSGACGRWRYRSMRRGGS
jgi:biotin operon repressor